MNDFELETAAVLDRRLDNIGASSAGTFARAGLVAALREEAASLFSGAYALEATAYPHFERSDPGELLELSRGSAL